MRGPRSEQTTVAILGGNPLVGRALELLLRGIGYDARFLEEDLVISVGRPELLLHGVQLLIVAPSISIQHRTAFLEGIRSASDVTEAKVLELITSPETGQAEIEGCVPWPCRMEELTRIIESTLSNDDLCTAIETSACS